MFGTRAGTTFKVALLETALKRVFYFVSDNLYLLLQSTLMNRLLRSRGRVRWMNIEQLAEGEEEGIDQFDGGLAIQFWMLKNYLSSLFMFKALLTFWC